MNRELRCPHCGRPNDMHETVQGAEPVPGQDVGICWKCHGLVKLTPFGFLRKLTPEEEEKERSEPDVRRALAAITESYTPDQALELLRHSE